MNPAVVAMVCIVFVSFNSLVAIVRLWDETSYCTESVRLIKCASICSHVGRLLLLITAAWEVIVLNNTSLNAKAGDGVLLSTSQELTKGLLALAAVVYVAGAVYKIVGYQGRKKHRKVQDIPRPQQEGYGEMSGH